MNKFKILLRVLFFTPLFFSLPNPSQAALNAYLTLVDSQGKSIEGENDIVPYVGKIAVYAYGHNLHLPYDAATGIPTGQKSHTPFQILKTVNKSTPLLNNAMVTGEVLQTFELVFLRPSKSGAEEEYYKIILDNARIVKITPSMAYNKVPENMQFEVTETVSFTYETIHWISLLPVVKETTDTWTSK